MALQECGLNLNKASQELQPHGSMEFPCAGYDSRYGETGETSIPWHWHRELEIILIAEGQMEIKIPAHTFLLEQGDLLVINTNIPHYGKGECHLRSLVFSPDLIAGREGMVFGKRYMEPLLSCGQFQGYLLKAGQKEPLSRWFGEAFAALVREDFGFEFTVRENLSRICLSLCEALLPQGKTQVQGADNLRIQKMLAYIHENFASDLALGDIAASAGISERECLRCFRKTIQLSPIQYLLKYRVMEGAEMLRKNPGSSVSEISALCGFDSPSHFAQTFKRFYNCTPREYRGQSLREA